MRLLIIEDDTFLCEILKFELEQEGYAVDTCFDGEEGLYYIRQKAHDVILLDQMLPIMSGGEVLKKIREEQIHTPVILVTALGETADKIRGLDLGADDYLVKPFDTGELLARIRSICRRPRNLEEQEQLSYADIIYYPFEKKLQKDGQTYLLTKKEGNLLEVFLRTPDTILNRQMILSKVWGPDSIIEEGNLDNYIYLIRKRLSNMKSVLTITTVRGIGYRLDGVTHV